MASLYKPLDVSKNEIRLLKFIEQPSTDKSGLVHCVLEHVSLEDFTSEFQAFLSEGGHSCNPSSLEPWLHFINRRSDNDAPTWTSHLSLPSWRQSVAHNEMMHTSNVWENAMEILAERFSRSARTETYPGDISWDFLGRGDPPVKLKSYVEGQGQFSLVPRFQWGDFEAISYCWESETRDFQIVLDQTVLAIPKNLQALLQRLKRLPDAKSGMKFWVDALCIDQSNVEERNQQVKLMQSIYTKAFAVIVWLGEVADESDDATDFITAIVSVTSKKDKEWGDVEFTQSTEILEVIEDGEGVRQLFSEMPWKALLYFLTRNYWHRLWIIQELALNHNMTLFLCGEKQLTRSIIRRACDFCIINSSKIDQFIANNQDIAASLPFSGSIWPTVYHVHSLITMPDQQSNRWKLEKVLNLGRNACAKDPRDKVYGLLGILPESIARVNSPDYTLSQDMVYSHFAMTLLHEYERVEEILSWSSFKPHCSLPSWIPDWTTEFARNHIRRLRLRRAGGPVPGVWSISEDGRYLRCRGFIVDLIETTSASPSENLPYGTAAPQKYKNLGSTGISHRYHDYNGLRAALGRTLILDHPDESDPESILNIGWVSWKEIKVTKDEKDLSSLWHAMQEITRSPFWESFDRFRQTNADFGVFGHSFREFFPSTPKYYQTTALGLHTPQLCSPSRTPITGLENEGRHNMPRATLAFVGRRMVTTKSGYLGMAPEAVQKGDLVSIICGCSFPVILRTCGDFYLVIGESYIDGIMDGEALEAQERGEYREVELTLC